jgi:uncharacterized protein YbaR (Trm112 family)
MTIDAQLVQVLVCPDDLTPLRLALDEQVKLTNQAIAKKRVHNRAGALVREPVDGLLVREDGQYGYAVRADIPVMLIEESIPLNQFNRS